MLVDLNVYKMRLANVVSLFFFDQFHPFDHIALLFNNIKTTFFVTLP